ncbi:MAG TPA: glycosyltransferase [Azoarcus taiwanensis]|nr:glycosyltransferase [Azoarcus taiwanensis]
MTTPGRLPADIVLCLYCPDWLQADAIELGLRHWLSPHPSVSTIRILTSAQHLERLEARRQAITTSGFEVHCSALPCEGIEAIAGCILSTHHTHPDRHIGLVRLDVQLPPDGLERLSNALRRAPGAGVVSPLSDEHPLLSPFAAPRPVWLRDTTLDRWIVQLNRGLVFDLPLISGRCALLRAEALYDWAASGQPELLKGLHTCGWASVTCDWVFADATGKTDTRSSDPDQPLVCGSPADLEQCRVASPLGPLRHAFSEIATRPPESTPPAANALKPFQLHVTHSWGGGLGKWIRDMCAADQARHNLVLRSIGTWGAFGQRLALYASAEMGHPIREWALHQPIRSVALAHHQYRQILNEIVRDFEVDVILVSSLIGHSLDALDTVCPTLFCAHDYFPYCPALVIRFEAVCTGCSPERLQVCFDTNPLNHFFKQTNASEWRAIRARHLQLMQRENVTLVAPSRSVINNLRALAPELETVTAHVVENGLEISSPPSFKPGERLTIVVLGSLSRHKGADLLLEVIDEITQFADVHLLGCGDDGERFASYGGVVRVAAYRADELPAMIAQIKPHLGLLLSIVPETFSYTLSELWALRVPAVATRVGAFADRIRHGQNGWLVEPCASPLRDTLRMLDRNRHLIEHARTEISRQPQSTCLQMVEAYHRLSPVGYAAGRPGPTPGALGDEQDRRGALIVDRQVPLRLVVLDFIHYLQDKTRQTPKLGRFPRATLMRLLALASRFLGTRR